MAGATAIGVGTAVYLRGLDVFQQITRELTEFMAAHGYADVAAMRGLAHLAPGGQVSKSK